MYIKLFFFSLFMFPLFIFGQEPLKINDKVPQLAIAKILNYDKKIATLKDVQKKITIIDFFGTWCVPCIKALPELENFKTNFKEDISIVLVSIEEETKLQNFINKRKPFAFPIVADEDKEFTNAFQPPSYPYTIVLNGNGIIKFIGNAADITTEILQSIIADELKSINAKEAPITMPPMEIPVPNKNTIATLQFKEQNELIKLSQNFMYAAKSKENVTTYIEQLKNLSYQILIDSLKDDNDKKSFWINLYNAYVNSSLQINAEQYKSRNKFFKSKNIIVAGKTFSLDDIEHGILRRNKVKWSLGYFGKLFPNKTQKQLRVNKLDYRIHFALNCGAKSCPPIAFYNSVDLDNQLDIATKAYLSSEAEYNKEDNILKLPAILGWFRRDFGGKKKMITLLKEKKIIQEDINPKIKFKKYDWTLYLQNYN